MNRFDKSRVAGVYVNIFGAITGAIVCTKPVRQGTAVRITETFIAAVGDVSMWNEKNTGVLATDTVLLASYAVISFTVDEMIILLQHNVLVTTLDACTTANGILCDW